jgi:energy-coupling factor transporter ATP-binding protein EcfA2
MSIEEFKPSADIFLDKSVVLFGSSGSGKSTLIIDILFYLKPFVDQVVVFSPMDKQNNTFGSGVIPRSLIHYTVTKEILDELWERQASFVAVYTQANRPEVLARLFARIPDAKPAKFLRVYAGRAEKAISENTDEAVAASMNKVFEEFKVRYYKKYIAEHAKYLSKQRLTTAETISLKHLDFNPRIVVIFDDCTDILKNMKNSKFVQNVFYQGRWSMITLILGLHDDKALSPEIKKNIFTTIYARQNVAVAAFERPSSGLSREEKQRALSATRDVFTPILPHQKLLYNQSSDRYFKYTATLRKGFRFGSNELWSLDSAIANADDDVLDSKSNKYIRDLI